MLKKIGYKNISDKKNPHAAMALLAMQDGDLELMGNYLKNCNGTVHPWVTSSLAKLILGSGYPSNYRLKLVRNPSLAKRQRGWEDFVSEERLNRNIALFMAEKGMDQRGQQANVIHQTSEVYNYKERKLRAIWKKHGKIAVIRRDAHKHARENRKAVTL
ncbi:hypothetical protein [Parasphingorhabdus sp.]|uniref:hypothetical protein n=1 Tax=Parasphingorhabdus sp. TaxID=2709688 RepID=UPI002F934F50